MIWDGIEQHQISLALPLLVAKGAKGVLACGYLNPETFTKTGEACAIVTGVNNFEEMLDATVVAVSKSAADLGIQTGCSGREALDQLR